MKRREFINISLAAIASTIGGLKLVQLDQFLESNGNKVLPENPDLYHSIIEFNVEKSELPLKLVTAHNFGDGSKEIIITKAGSYTCQFLGDYYGWNIV